MEDDFKQLESQRQQIDTGRLGVQRLQTEVERNRRELEKAWEHLRGEQRRLGEQKPRVGQAAVLDEATARQIQELLERLPSAVASMEAVPEQLNLCNEIVATQQGILTQHRQQEEQQRLIAQQHQEAVDSHIQALQSSNQEWQQAQNSLEQLLSELQRQTLALNSKQEYVQMLNMHSRNQEKLYQQISHLSKASDAVAVSQIDLEALENMPLAQLQQLVQDLQGEWQKNSRFVNDQEEELRFQQQAIDELQANLSQANQDERKNLETEVADEQDRYQMLNQTLVGQRQNLLERREFLIQHCRVLRQKQGINAADAQEDQIDLQPILIQIEEVRQQQTQELQNLEQQISQMRSSIEQLQGAIDSQASVQEMKQQELQSLEQNLLSLRTMAAESWGRVNLYQEILQPVQDCLNGLREQLEAISGAYAREVTGDDLQAIIAQMRQILSIMPGSLTAS